MVKYKLSKYVAINNVDSYDAIPEEYADGYFIMYDEIGDSEYLINSTIKYYIDKFSTYKTEDEVVREVESDVQCSDKELTETCSRFFNFLCKLKVLVPDNKTEDIIINTTLYKEGDTIDDFRVVKVLSNRSYTDVYCVTDTTGDFVYVIKLLNRKKATSDSRYYKEFIEMEQEYRMLQNTECLPSINRAYGFQRYGDSGAYLILEYINGKSLSKYLKEEGNALTFSDSLYIIESIIDAFSCLHQHNIIHGDIHSSNILVTNEKEIKIIDLGMSRSVTIKENEITKTGGVYFYMPPERINTTTFKKFSAEPDLVSDVYQVGLLIYLVLYNTLPFDGFTWEELARCIKENKITCPDVTFLNQPVPFKLVNIIKKCLDKEPLKRYKDASGILTDFKEQVLARRQAEKI